MHARTILFAVLASLTAFADPIEVAAPPKPVATEPQRLGAFAGLGYLGSPGAHGAAFTTGARLRMGNHFALSLDLGYGLVGAAASKQDRWWIMPSVAFVIPAGPVRFDLGAGLGVGAASGYPSWSAYGAAPFMPAWAFQLVPTVRGHVMATKELTSNVDVFARLDVASLVLGGNSIGSREGNEHAGLRDTTWANLWLGIQFRLL